MEEAVKHDTTETKTDKSDIYNQKGKLKPVQTAIAVVVLAAAVFGGVRYWMYASQYTSTDDAAVSNDVVQIAPQVSGTVKHVYVTDNQAVKAGELIAVLDDATYKATVQQKQADLDAAIAQAKGAGVGVALASEIGNAQIQQAQGMIGQAESGINSAIADVDKGKAAVMNASALYRSAQSGINTAKAALNAAKSNHRKAADSIDSAMAALQGAEAGVHAAEAVYDKAKADVARSEQLVERGAISRQLHDADIAAERTAKAQLDNAKAVVSQRQADLNSAKAQVESAQAAIEQANAQLSGAVDQAAASHTGIVQASAQYNSVKQNVAQAKAKHSQAMGQLSQAQTAPRQVAVSETAVLQAKAKIEQAKAALDAAKLQLSYTRIYAPISGKVSKKSVEEGALVQVGSPLMAILPEGNVWVTANFKETQMKGMADGKEAKISIDSLPGKQFVGHVDSIASGTGSTFALLPPDNATGNFVKVVQRIPVKIVFNAGQSGMNSIRAGMSVNVSVKTK